MLISFEQLFLFLGVYIPVLLTVAFFVLFERKLLASIQRRLGPKIIGLWGLLQSMADGLKLILKQYVSPSKINKVIFFFSPILCFTLSFSAWIVIPFTFINVLCECNSQVLIVLALSSLNVYTIIFSGWSSNSKYALFGSLRAAAQVISYELALTTSLLPIILSSGSLNFSNIVNHQQNLYNFFLFFPVSFIFLISGIAETNRPPFDLPEAEAEIVAGYNVEYSSIPFAFFFLAEYCNVLTICASWSMFFGGGWINFIGLELIPVNFWLSLKICFFSFLFVFIRGILPRYRYDQLMALGWKCLFPLVFSFFVFISGSFCFFDILPDNSNNLFTDEFDLNKILYPTYTKPLVTMGFFCFIIRLPFVYSVMPMGSTLLWYYYVGMLLYICMFFVFLRIWVYKRHPSGITNAPKGYWKDTKKYLVFLALWFIFFNIIVFRVVLINGIWPIYIGIFFFVLHLVFCLIWLYKFYYDGTLAAYISQSRKDISLVSFFLFRIFGFFCLLLVCFILLLLYILSINSMKLMANLNIRYQNIYNYFEAVENYQMRFQKMISDETWLTPQQAIARSEVQNMAPAKGELITPFDIVADILEYLATIADQNVLMYVFVNTSLLFLAVFPPIFYYAGVYRQRAMSRTPNAAGAFEFTVYSHYSVVLFTLIGSFRFVICCAIYNSFSQPPGWDLFWRSFFIFSLIILIEALYYFLKKLKWWKEINAFEYSIIERQKLLGYPDNATFDKTTGKAFFEVTRADLLSSGAVVIDPKDGKLVLNENFKKKLQLSKPIKGKLQNENLEAVLNTKKLEKIEMPFQLTKKDMHAIIRLKITAEELAKQQVTGHEKFYYFEIFDVLEWEFEKNKKRKIFIVPMFYFFLISTILYWGSFLILFGF